jgi:hypothetical protein
MGQAVANLIPAAAFLAIVVALAAAYLARLRRISTTNVALLEANLQAAVRQAEAMERIATAMETRKDSGLGT